MITEQPNGDFGQTIMRQFLYTSFAKPLFHQLKNSKDSDLAAIASKTAKETDYHFRHSSQWLIRLGDGTEESHRRMVIALDHLWMYTADLFETTDDEKTLASEGFIVSFENLKENWMETIEAIFSSAGLSIPSEGYQLKGSVKGIHTEHLGFILAEMQFMQRAYPNLTW